MEILATRCAVLEGELRGLRGSALSPRAIMRASRSDLSQTGGSLLSGTPLPISKFFDAATADSHRSLRGSADFTPGESVANIKAVAQTLLTAVPPAPAPAVAATHHVLQSELAASPDKGDDQDIFKTFPKKRSDAFTPAMREAIMDAQCKTGHQAAAALDTTGDGRANYIVVGEDRNHDGIPDVLERPNSLPTIQRAAAVRPSPQTSWVSAAGPVLVASPRRTSLSPHPAQTHGGITFSPRAVSPVHHHQGTVQVPTMRQVPSAGILHQAPTLSHVPRLPIGQVGPYGAGGSVVTSARGASPVRRV